MVVNVAFWNLGNLFDTNDDPIGNDFGFRADEGWTDETKQAKITNLAAVIDTMFDGQGPDLLGICEVENNPILQELLDAVTATDQLQIARATDNTDIRGIDCALAIRSDKFTVIDFNEANDGEPPTSSHLVHNRYPTRDILEVALRVNDTGEELLVYVNHWPSRSRGRYETEPLRVAAANHLGRIVDRRLKFTREQLADLPDEPATASRIQARWNRNVLIMGDLNDEPFDRSVREELRASSGLDRLEQPVTLASGSSLPRIVPYSKLQAPLFNCMWPLTAEPDRGTYFFGPGYPTFNVLDQFIVSRGLYYGLTGLRMTRHTTETPGLDDNPPLIEEHATVAADVFDSPLMWTSSTTKRPKRFEFDADENGQVTHNGASRGTSDHFPIVTSFDTAVAPPT